MKKLFAIFILFFVACFGLKMWFDDALHHPLPLQAPLKIELAGGAGVRNLAHQLFAEKLVAHPLVVRLAARVYGYDRRLKAGEFLIEPEMSLLDLFEKISGGKVLMYRLTLPEGLTTREMLSLIDENPLLAGEITQDVEEGALLPETYTFSKGTSKNEIIAQAERSMAQALEEAWENRAEGLPYASAQELLVMASIVEKETGLGDERAKVASVFVNRLQKGMLLQTDPTVIYAITLGKEPLNRSLTRSDLSVDSPYNTYKYAGLPPTPIANPGKQALHAAAHPEETPYFYFVANGQGGHNFSKTLTEHNQNVQNWRKTRNK